MIRAVTTEEQKQTFAHIIDPWPAQRAVMGRDLVLWAGNPGAPSQLFLLDDRAALLIYGATALLCGDPGQDGWQELAAFLQFTGTAQLRSTVPAPGWPVKDHSHCFVLPAGSRLPPCPLPGGTAVDTDPPASELAAIMFPENEASRDVYYVKTNAARNHGMGLVWLLRDGQGAPASTVTATLYGGEAYLQMGYTLPHKRRQGLYRALITAMANELAGQGKTVTLYCAPALCGLYEAFGFTQNGKIFIYSTECIGN